MAREDESGMGEETETGSESRRPGDFARLRSAKRDVIAHQEQGWREGSPPSIAQLFELWPGDPETDPDAASLIAEDFLQRKCQGEEPCLDGIPASLPRAPGIVRGVDRLAVDDDGEHAARPIAQPAQRRGTSSSDFDLRSQLGRGTFARVFLAEQADLAGRPVVLKISAIEGDEPQTLAQLQHTNIVPIYSVHEDHHAGLRAVCMPFFGGANLTSVLEQLRRNTETPRKGA